MTNALVDRRVLFECHKPVRPDVISNRCERMNAKRIKAKPKIWFCRIDEDVCQIG